MKEGSLKPATMKSLKPTDLQLSSHSQKQMAAKNRQYQTNSSTYRGNSKALNAQKQGVKAVKGVNSSRLFSPQIGNKPKFTKPSTINLKGDVTSNHDQFSPTRDPSQANQMSTFDRLYLDSKIPRGSTKLLNTHRMANKSLYASVLTSGQANTTLQLGNPVSPISMNLVNKAVNNTEIDSIGPNTTQGNHNEILIQANEQRPAPFQPLQGLSDQQPPRKTVGVPPLRPSNDWMKSHTTIQQQKRIMSPIANTHGLMNQNTSRVQKLSATSQLTSARIQRDNMKMINKSYKEVQMTSRGKRELLHSGLQRRLDGTHEDLAGQPSMDDFSSSRQALMNSHMASSKATAFKHQGDPALEEQDDKSSGHTNDILKYNNQQPLQLLANYMRNTKSRESKLQAKKLGTSRDPLTYSQSGKQAYLEQSVKSFKPFKQIAHPQLQSQQSYNEISQLEKGKLAGFQSVLSDNVNQKPIQPEPAKSLKQPHRRDRSQRINQRNQEKPGSVQRILSQQEILSVDIPSSQIDLINQKASGTYSALSKANQKAKKAEGPMLTYRTPVPEKNIT